MPRDSLNWSPKIWSRSLMRMSWRWVFSPPCREKGLDYVMHRESQLLSVLLSCSCAVWETWTWTTGEKTQSTRAATAPTTLSSSGSGRYRSFMEPSRFVCLSDSNDVLFFSPCFRVCFSSAIDCAVDGCRKANPTLAVCDWNISGPNERLCRALRWGSCLDCYQWAI